MARPEPILIPEPDMDENADRQEIATLFATYNINGDRGHVQAMSVVFAEDALMEIPTWRAEGRAAIIEALTPKPDPNARPSGPPDICRHHLTSSLVTFDGPDDAHGRSYFIRYSEKGADHSGLYVDRLRRIDGRWKIVHRQVRLDWRAPDSRLPPEMLAGEAARVAGR